MHAHVLKRALNLIQFMQDWGCAHAEMFVFSMWLCVLFFRLLWLCSHSLSHLVTIWTPSYSQTHRDAYARNVCSLKLSTAEGGRVMPSSASWKCRYRTNYALKCRRTWKRSLFTQMHNDINIAIPARCQNGWWRRQLTLVTFGVMGISICNKLLRT